MLGKELSPLNNVFILLLFLLVISFLLPFLLLQIDSDTPEEKITLKTTIWIIPVICDLERLVCIYLFYTKYVIM